MLGRSVLSKISKFSYKINDPRLKTSFSTSTTVDPKDVEHHGNFASVWWDQDGPLAPLHALNPIRVRLIRDGLISASRIKPELHHTSSVLDGLHILEVGCGGGLLTEKLARLHAKVTAIDPGIEMIKVAKNHLKEKSPELTDHITYITESIEEHVRDNVNKYDAVVLSEVVEHVDNIPKFLSASVETLKPGGSVFITTPNRTPFSWFGTILMSEHVFKAIPKGTHQYEKFIQPVEMQRLLIDAGSPLVYSPAPRGTCNNCCPIREARDIQFLLYTRSNAEIPDPLYVTDTKLLKQSHFNMSSPTVLYMHGFSEHAPGGANQSSQEIRDAFLKAGDYNVILVDWSPLTALPWYMNAVQNMPRVARYIARFLRFLNKSGLAMKKMHVIGFSLGAEVAGFAGQQLQEWGVMLPRITGLDPAFPLFDEGSPHRRLSPSDAEFVDVIHTDGGLLGNPYAMGHADFYPNGGTPLQPGCVGQEIANNRWLGIILGCSHQRAWQYFIESLKWPESFRANRCEKSENSDGKEYCHEDLIAFMGIAANKRLRGKYYLETNEQSPYGRNL